MMMTSTPETTRISIVVSINSLSLSFYLLLRVFLFPVFNAVWTFNRNPDSSPSRSTGINLSAALLENYSICNLRNWIESIRMITPASQMHIPRLAADRNQSLECHLMISW